MQCSVCNGIVFEYREVLWKELISEWQLECSEVEYINRQQGQACVNCGANLRSIVLAKSIQSFLGTTNCLDSKEAKDLSEKISLLEINEAGTLTNVLKGFDDYHFCSYPEVDMHQMPYQDNAFDLVVHSDTLEHIKNPIHALMECKRILKPGGALAYTIPIIVGRLTRDRQGLPASYHGNATDKEQDYTVQTEFGSDAWTYAMRAGFTEMSIFTFQYPSAISFLLKNT